MIQKKRKSLIAYSYSHFAVDFACFFIMPRAILLRGKISDYMIAVLLYNIIAFGLQPIIGYICDSYGGRRISMFGCILVFAAVLFIPSCWISVTLCAVGNACFHVGGGIDSLVNADGKMSRSGIFVSTGSIGLMLGTWIGNRKDASILIPLVILVIAFLLLRSVSGEEVQSGQSEFQVASDRSYIVIILLAFLSIVMRGLATVGFYPTTTTAGIYYMFLSGIAICLGKILGGFAGDRFGARKAGLGSLLLSIPFLCFRGRYMVCLFIGLVLFNMTMPISLCAIASKLPNHSGLAFGITTLALLCGSLVTYVWTIPENFILLFLILFIIISAICIGLITKNKEEVV